MSNSHRHGIPGTTPGKLEAVRNGMPERSDYVYRGGSGRPLHGHSCPVCGGKVRSAAQFKDMGMCLGRCRALVKLKAAVL